MNIPGDPTGIAARTCGRGITHTSARPLSEAEQKRQEALAKLSKANSLILSAAGDLCDLEGPGYFHEAEWTRKAGEEIAGIRNRLRGMHAPIDFHQG